MKQTANRRTNRRKGQNCSYFGSFPGRHLIRRVDSRGTLRPLAGLAGGITMQRRHAHGIAPKSNANRRLDRRTAGGAR